MKHNYMRVLDWTSYSYGLHFERSGCLVLMGAGCELLDDGYSDALLDFDPLRVLYLIGKSDGFIFTLSEFRMVVMGHIYGPVHESSLWAKFCEYHVTIKSSF
jgi:hypothetical protein